MMSGNSVSIVAPAYNHEGYIRRCLESVAGQDIPHMELIIIDDMSKDNTRDVIENLLRNKDFTSSFEDGITFIRHEANRGAFYTLNEGLQMADGHYLAMINTDDYYGRDRLKLLLDACEEEGAEFAFGRVHVVDQDDDPVTSGYGSDIMKYQHLIRKCPTVSMSLTRGNAAISTGNMLFSRRLYQQLGGFANYKYVHDWDFALRASLITEPVYVEDAEYHYRIHTGNTIAEISGGARNADALEKPEHGKTIGINPLVHFFINVQNNRYTNERIPPMAAWEYFARYKRYYYDDDAVLWAWNRAKRLKDLREFQV